VFLEEHPGESDHVLRLGAEEADGPDVLLEARLAQGGDRLRRAGRGKELAGGEIHALVRGLRREHDRHQQL